MKYTRKELKEELHLCDLKIRILKNVSCEKNAKNGEYNKNEVKRVMQEIYKRIKKFY